MAGRVATKAIRTAPALEAAELAAWIRGHWGIENLLHHVRDRTFREDDSKIRTAGVSWLPGSAVRRYSDAIRPAYARPGRDSSMAGGLSAHRRARTNGSSGT